MILPGLTTNLKNMWYHQRTISNKYIRISNQTKTISNQLPERNKKKVRPTTFNGLPCSNTTQQRRAHHLLVSGPDQAAQSTQGASTWDSGKLKAERPKKIEWDSEELTGTQNQGLLLALSQLEVCHSSCLMHSLTVCSLLEMPEVIRSGSLW